MRKSVLFIAMSMDGYIADAQGGVDWLRGQEEGGGEMDSYAAFLPSVDTVVMGWNTYHQIVTQLSPEEWPYAGLTSYVVTHRQAMSTQGILFSGQDPCELVRELKGQRGKDIWICGGADVAQQLIEADLVDEYQITVIPTLLGGGIRLFGTTSREIELELVDSQGRNGMVELVYVRRGSRRQADGPLAGP